MQSAASWTTEWRYCSDIAIDGITIFSRANLNGDVFDFDGCNTVRVSNSVFDTSDDACACKPRWSKNRAEMWSSPTVASPANGLGYASGCCRGAIVFVEVSESKTANAPDPDRW